MTILAIPQENKKIENYFEIKNFLNKHGVFFEKWIMNETLPQDSTDGDVLGFYSKRLKAFMDENNFKDCDVVQIHPETENLEILREKFIQEHMHSEDEVRFFVEGKGVFWLRIPETNEVFSILCEKGDLLSVPANLPHWFDFGQNPYVKAIRIFSNTEGWIAKYTNTQEEKKYLNYSEDLLKKDQ